MPPSGDEASLNDDEFVVPEDPVEQERFKRRLMATANSLKKKQQQLRADQDLLADRWTEVLAAEEHELERPSKSYPKRKLLLQYISQVRSVPLWLCAFRAMPGYGSSEGPRGLSVTTTGWSVSRIDCW